MVDLAAGPELNFIQRALNGHAALAYHMGINHGRTDICMTEQFLYGSNIITVFKQMGGKAVAECVAGDLF